MPTFSKFLNGFRGCKQVLDSDGYIYSRKKNDDTVLSSAWRFFFFFFFFFFFLKRGWAWLAHERIAYECFAYLWGTAVLWEDASGIMMCNQG